MPASTVSGPIWLAANASVDARRVVVMGAPP